MTAKPDHHILICSSAKLNGEPKGTCQKKSATDLCSYIQSEIYERGLDNLMVTFTGCMNRCDDGPIMIVYPENLWYGLLNDEKIDIILDAIEQGKSADELLLK
jgi:(2Fe-2S) ferredoxin